MLIIPAINSSRVGFLYADPSFVNIPYIKLPQINQLEDNICFLDPDWHCYLWHSAILFIPNGMLTKGHINLTLYYLKQKDL